MCVLHPKCRKCGTTDSCIACDQNLDEASRLRAEVSALREQLKAAHKVVAAVRKECKKFRFPDEDRPDLFEALIEYDDFTIAKMEEEE